MERGSSGGRGAVLLIGPLFWGDAADRRAWRDLHLDMDRAERVHAAVFHGGWCARRGEYLITLARRGAHGVGTARVVPLRRPADDLEAVARALWDVEGAGEAQAGIGSASATVGALCPARGGVAGRWAGLVRSGRVLLPDGRERTPLDASGLLDMDWPARVGGGAPDFDVILALVTVPLGPPPRPEEIAATLLADEAARACFYRNRLSGITTSDDDRIICEMRTLFR